MEALSDSASGDALQQLQFKALDSLAIRPDFIDLVACYDAKALRLERLATLINGECQFVEKGILKSGD